ncbi:MAG TPA: DNA-3-methyladenine glycosylase [Thermoanaerobaculia bacterium]|nr:DNA-3-methyladenine glycosylase [Thermoanaerobaculia bacterium]
MIGAEDNPLKPLPLSFYRRDTGTVARDLLGCRLVRRLPDGSERSVVIVETEAYLGVRDRAAHTWNGRKTPRVAPMWGPGGHAYVYFVYGMHHCLNVVTRKEGEPEAVLIRAGAPDGMWCDPGEGEGGRPSRMKIASGPARLCRYLDITTTLSGASLLGPDLFVVSPPRKSLSRSLPLLVGPRVGVAYAGEAARWPLRFALGGCPAVTHAASLRPL